MNVWSLFLTFCWKIQGNSESQTKRACFRCGGGGQKLICPHPGSKCRRTELAADEETQDSLTQHRQHPWLGFGLGQLHR